MEHVIIRDLTKVIKNHIILGHIHLSFDKGKIYGLWGRNGSGKTMLLRAIAGLIHPSDGEIIIDGHILHKDIDFYDSLGLIIENMSLYPQYSAYDNLYLLSKIKNIASREDIIESIKAVGLDPFNKKKVKTYSLGMKQKLNIAQAIFENQDLILLDEPTNGLDELSVDMIYELFHKLAKENKTVIIASHNKDDLKKHCDEIIEISDGKII